MERLTKNYGEAFKPFNYVLKDKSDVIPGSFGTYECFYGHQMAVQRLGYYEDLEEQGLLLKLPCKVGDTVYYISEKSEKQGRKKVLVSFIAEGTIDNIVLGSVMIPQITVCDNENEWDGGTNVKANKIKLKPCSICKGNNIVVETWSSGGRMYMIKCNNPDCPVHDDGYPTGRDLEKVKEEWNNRN